MLNSITLNNEKFYAHSGIVGIKPNGEIYEGYNGHFGTHEGGMTQEDKVALAKLMIERWQKFLIEEDK